MYVYVLKADSLALKQKALLFEILMAQQTADISRQDQNDFGT